MKKAVALVLAAVLALATPASVLAEEWDDIIGENDFVAGDEDLIIAEEEFPQNMGESDQVLIEEPEIVENEDYDKVSAPEASDEDDVIPEGEEFSLDVEEDDVILEIEGIEKVDASEIPEELRDEEDEGLQTFSVEVGNTVTTVSNPTPEASHNTGAQSYGNYAETNAASSIYSYLEEVSSGFMRVEYTGSQIAVEYYDSGFTLTSKKYVAMELPLFGGFYAGSDAYYLVYGQENPNEDDTVEVIRIVKYSTDWVRLGSASLCGGNTTTPFDAGLRMTECGGYLYIRSSHRMYASSDGSHHQANFTIEVDESAMEITDSNYDLMSNSVGYVSHSFNQFIMVDDENNLVTVDHGDGYPRAAILMRYKTKAGESTFSSHQSDNNDRINLLSFQGVVGDNYTAASIGGLEYSSSSYLTAGNSVTQDENWDSHTANNIFVAVTSRDDLSTSVKWITDYDTDGSISASTPQLVKVGSDSFLLLWTTFEYWNSQNSEYSRTSKLHYVFLDGKGNLNSEIYTVDGQLSDCKPIVAGNSVIWYATSDASSMHSMSSARLYVPSRVISTTPYFYMIGLDGSYKNVSPLETPTIVSLTPTSDGIEVNWTEVAGAEQYYIYYYSDEGYGYFRTSEGNETNYTIQKSTLTSGLTYLIWVDAYANGKKSLVKEKQEFLYLKTPSVTLSTTDTGIQMSWEEVKGAEGYQIYRKSENGKYVLIQTTSECSWLDKTVSSGTAYTYQVYAYVGDAVSGGSPAKTKTYVASPASLDLSDEDGRLLVSWKTVDGAEQYRVYYKWSTMSSFSSKTVTAKAGNKQSLTLTSPGDTKICEVYVAAVANSTTSLPTETKSIELAAINISDLCTIQLSSSSYTYDGSAHKPNVTVKGSSRTLTNGTDYTLSYKNNINAGTATVTVTGTGNYTGTLSSTFTIDKANQKVTAKAEAPTIGIGETTTISAGGQGTITYSSDNTSIATVSSNGVVTGKSEGYVTITIQAAGDKNYNSGKTTIMLLVAKKSESISGSNGIYWFSGTSSGSAAATLKKGSTYTVGDLNYKITSLPASGTGAVTVAGLANSSVTKISIPAKVAIGGRSFKVTKISSKAFKGCKNLKSVSVGKNVTTIGNQAFSGCKKMSKATIKTGTTKIGKKAFYNCKKLKTITIKSKKLTSVGKNAFKGIKSNATIKVPKSKLSSYKKLLKGKGQGSKVKITS